MELNSVLDFFTLYWTDFVNLASLENRPFLAHYTTLSLIENIIKSNELWFSNPLFMNDLEEMRFGMLQGQRFFNECFDGDAFIKAGGISEHTTVIRTIFNNLFQHYDQELALNVFVFCFSEFYPTKPDGLLSMWCGYGANGGGVAFVINPDFITVRNESPLLIAKVRYETAN